MVSKVAQKMVSKVAYHGPRPAKCLHHGPRPDRAILNSWSPTSQICLLQGQAWANQTEAFFNVVNLGSRLTGNRTKSP